MVQFFICYSHIDKATALKIAKLVRRVYGDDNVWLDEELRGGEVWEPEILKKIEWADLFLYLLSREALESTPCQKEFEEAKRLGKKIIPITIRTIPEQARGLLKILEDIKQIQMVDMLDVDSVNGINDLHAAILYSFELVPHSSDDWNVAKRSQGLESKPLEAPLRITDFRVPSNQEGGINTGILVKSGDHISISAKGVITFDTSYHTPADPDGLPLRWALEEAYKTRDAIGIIGSLIGWINEYNEHDAFLVGKHFEKHVEGIDGYLYLAVNDAKGNYIDNKGEFLVTIEVKRE